MAVSYIVLNCAQPTTAAPVKQPTGTAIRTMMQLRFAAGVRATIIKWGCSFDGFAAALPGQVELFETTTAATMSSAYAAADIMPYTPYEATANTAGASGVPLNLSTTTSGFATAAVTEGTVAGYRAIDTHLIAPTNQYVHDWPLEREFECTPQNYIRVRVTFGTTVNMSCFLLFELDGSLLRFSGGTDSTALVVRMAELGEDFSCLFTPAGDEPDDLHQHIDAIIRCIGRPLVQPPNLSLMFWIQKHQALPNFRQRWCTRQIKIEPCIAYLMQQTDPVLCIGLRADEEQREGLYGSYATYRYPLREWGWTKRDVRHYLDQHGITVPPRTNCDLCYDQQLGEWWALWKHKPEKFAKGEALESQMGHTFRSAQRDTWPAALADLRVKFEAGYIPRGADYQGRLFDQDTYGRCRVCTL